MHLKDIFSKELNVCKNFLYTAEDGKNFFAIYNIKSLYK